MSNYIDAGTQSSHCVYSHSIGPHYGRREIQIREYKYKEEELYSVWLIGTLVWAHNSKISFCFVHRKELGAMTPQ